MFQFGEEVCCGWWGRVLAYLNEMRCWFIFNLINIVYVYTTLTLAAFKINFHFDFSSQSKDLKI